jgi:hypothetical protein
MKQSLICPNCNSAITADQQFCGICGAKLVGTSQQQTETQQPQTSSKSKSESQTQTQSQSQLEPQNQPQSQAPTITCLNCGSPMAQGQAVCTVCGFNMYEPQPIPVATPQPSPMQQAISSTPVFSSDVQAPVAPLQVTSAPRPVGREGRINRYGLLSFAAIIFQVIGWIIWIGGGIASIAMIIFALMGGGFQPIIPGIGNILGGAAVVTGFVSLLVSLFTGLVFTAFADLFNATVEIVKNVRPR